MVRDPISCKRQAVYRSYLENNGLVREFILDHFALHPQKQGCLLGTGTGWEEGERVKARPRIPPEKDWRDRGPPPE